MNDMPRGGGPAVTVTVTGDHVAVMDPPVPDLEPVLEYRTRTFATGGPGGWRQAEEARSLCEFDARGRLVFPAGLLGRVRPVLRDRGYRVVVDDRRGAGPGVGTDAFHHLPKRDRALVRAVAKHPLGRIEVGSDAQAVRACDLLDPGHPGGDVRGPRGVRRGPSSCGTG